MAAMKPTLIALLALGLCLPLAGAEKDKPAAGKEAAEKAYDEGRYADAVRLFAAELAKEEAKPKPDWVWLAYYNSYLGLAHRNAGQYDKALEFHHKKLAIDLKHRGKDHPRVADTYMNIGIVHDEKAEYDKALEFYNKSLAIDLVKLGKDHPSVGLTYYNMALTYGAKKNVIKKKELLRKAYAIQLEKLGKDHPETKATEAALFGP